MDLYGALMAFDIENAGEHEIEFKYMPKIYVLTGIISIASTGVFVGLIAFERSKSKKRAKVNEAIETEGEN